MLALAFKSILREWRAGELRLLALALIIAIACVSAINLFSARVHATLRSNASQILGANLVVQSATLIPENWHTYAKQIGLQQTVTLSFLSMVNFQQRLQLANITAVQSPYPLLGEVTIANKLFGPAKKVYRAPKVNTVWVESRLFPLLKIKVGDRLKIGYANFKVAAVLQQQPGQLGDWFNISPKILMNWHDIKATKVVQPGSRLVYRWLLMGTAAQLVQLEQYLKGKLSGQQQLLSANNSSPAISSAIKRASDYLRLGGILSLLLAGIAITMALRNYSQRHRQQVALLRCFGAKQKQIMYLYSLSLLLFAMITSIIGLVIGYLCQPVMAYLFAGLIQAHGLTATFTAAIFSVSTGLVILFGFSFGELIQLTRIAPNIIFRNEVPRKRLAWLSYIFAAITLFSIAYFYIQSWQLVILVFLSVLLAIAFILILLLVLFKALGRLRHFVGMSWRFGLANLARHWQSSAFQVVALVLSVTAILTLFLVRNNLFESWMQQLPQHAANYFVINIEQPQIKAMNKFLQQKHIAAARIYPLIRGRLVQLNGHSIQQVLGARAKHIRALQRELNLSWSKQLPEGNQLLTGRWLTSNAGEAWVSVEQGLARRIGLKMGDELGFRIGANLLTAKVSSLRKLDWSTFKPNFYMLFRPDLLAQFPKTYMTSFYLPATRKFVLNDLIQAFPNATVIDVAIIMQNVRRVLHDTSQAINFISVFSLLVGLCVIALAMLALSDEKRKEMQTLHILGMRRRQLLWVQTSESMVIGVITGLLACLFAYFINQYIAQTILNTSFYFPQYLLVLTPLATTLLMLGVNVLML